MKIATETLKKMVAVCPLLSTNEFVISPKELKYCRPKSERCPHNKTKNMTKSIDVVTIFPSETGPSNENADNPKHFKTTLIGKFKNIFW
jgi:hypothetical protein